MPRGGARRSCSSSPARSRRSTGGGRAARGVRARGLRLLCRLGLRARTEQGLLPHTNVGICTREELSRLRAVTASQGLMLESINPDLTVHAGSPTKHPERRLETIRHAGELRIPFTSGILVGIGERPEERLAALAALAELQREYGHLQEVILQNFVLHPLLRRGAGADRRRGPALGRRGRAAAAGAAPALGSGGDARRHAGAGP